MHEDWHTFITAVENDDVKTVALLRSNFPDNRMGFAVLQATMSNSVNVVAELLNNPTEDILAYALDALDLAAQHGHVDVLTIVLPHTDPKINNSNALLWAVRYNHQQCVDVLFEVSDVDVVWQNVNERRAEISDEVFDYFERMMVRKQHAKLTEEVEHSGGMRGARKL